LLSNQGLQINFFDRPVDKENKGDWLSMKPEEMMGTV
jgi:hypothetical protein